MIAQFYGNKKYIFRKELYRHFWDRFPPPWCDIIDGQMVKVIDKDNAVCIVDNNVFYVSPRWCEEVQDE